eukprot:SAG25_NODE_1127_length_3875_cov_3.733316_6_plen_136_part_00
MAGREGAACGAILLSVALFVLNSELMQEETASAFLMIWLCHSAMAVLRPLSALLPGVAGGGEGEGHQHWVRRHTERWRWNARPMLALAALHMGANYLFVVALSMSSVAVVSAICTRGRRVASVRVMRVDISRLLH